MSEITIARWNAISLTRIETEQPSLKRQRPEDESDDDVSIVSRTPSPEPMDVDNIHNYDDYVRGHAREVITVETKIKPENKGFTLLAKMGWIEGQPLGLSGDGRVDPIPFQIKNDSTGIGKITQDVEMIETTVSQRRGLDSERQRKETEDQRRAREDSVARKTAVETEISMTLKAFYCSLCDKQFKTVAQYDEHTNSYAHHHKARFRDMQANARIIPKEEVDKRKEKERKREEKELRKIAAANGIKMPKPPAQISSTPPILKPTELTAADNNPKPAEIKKGGWASLAHSPASAVNFQKGWTPASSSSASAPPGPSRLFGASSSSQSTPFPSDHYSSPPSFRTAGYTSLDTDSSHPHAAPPLSPPPPPPPDAVPSLPPVAPPSFSSPQPVQQENWSNTSTKGFHPTPGGWNQTHIAPLLPTSMTPPLPPVDKALPTSMASLPFPPPVANQSQVAQPVRSGWQQFQSFGRGRGRR